MHADVLAGVRQDPGHDEKRRHATAPQRMGCVTQPVTLVGVSNVVHIVHPLDEKWLYRAVRVHPTG